MRLKKLPTMDARSGTTRRQFMAGLASAAVAVPWISRSAFAATKPVKIGLVVSQTGAAAAFGEATNWVVDSVAKALADGVTIAGTKRPVQIITRDSQTNPNRAAEVTAQLINNDAVDIVVSPSASETTIVVSDQCELAGVPCVSSNTAWQIWFFGRKGDPKKGFDWTYHFFFGVDQIADVYARMWKTLPTNNIVGILLTNDDDGVASSHPEHGFGAAIKRYGFDVRGLGLYPPASDDFTAQITQLKSINADIVSGLFNPPQFAVFWAQCAQQGYFPKIMTPLKSALFSSSIEALGERGAGISTVIWWSPNRPFKSGLTSMTAKDYCAAYEASSGQQWTQPLGFIHAGLEVAVDVLKRTKALEPAAIRDALADTDYASIVGPIRWKGGPPTHPLRNISTTPLVGGQWEHGRKYKFELKTVYNESWPEIPLDGKLRALGS